MNQVTNYTMARSNVSLVDATFELDGQANGSLRSWKRRAERKVVVAESQQRAGATLANVVETDVAPIQLHNEVAWA